MSEMQGIVPEPGVQADLSLGLPGDPEPLLSDDSAYDYLTEINTNDDPDADGEDEVDE